MEIKALLFAYCSSCEGVNVVLDDYNILSRLDCGEVKQGCAFHAPEVTTVEVVCQKCKGKTAIARFTIIYDIDGAIGLIKLIEDNLDKIGDQAANLTIEAGFDDYVKSDNFLERLRTVALKRKEMTQLRGAIKSYRFNTDAPQTYYHRGVYKTAD